MPPHRGHQYLIETALTQTERLTILVCSLKREPIPGPLRYGWLRALYPQARVVHVTDENPSYPDEHPDFWQIWTDTVRRHTDEPPQAVFTSEHYGDELARHLGAQHIMVDLDRRHVPVSATQIRARPLANWDFIAPVARPYFVKRVALAGPESSGKTTLTQELAAHFHAAYVPEFARAYVDNCGLAALTLADIEAIARGQQKSEEQQAGSAHRLLFCDTDLLTTTLWSEYFFGACPAWLEEAACAAHYDLTLLLAPDVAWVDDPQRVGAEFRAAFYEKLRRKLTACGRAFCVISGDYTARRHQAIAAINRAFDL